MPQHLVIVGAGIIGLELGSVWRRLGARVTLIELMPRILAGFDTELATTAEKIFRKQGLEFMLETRIQEARVEEGEVIVTYTDTHSRTHELHCDRLLVCIGRQPFTDGLGLEALGIRQDSHGRVEVDHEYQTSLPGIYAIGDVIRGPMLAHKAEDEGIVAVERMKGLRSHVNYQAIPSVVYTWPEIASVGATEEELLKAETPFKRGQFPFSANGRARALGHTDGWVKILAHCETDEILGAHIIGPRAGDLLEEIVIAMEFGGSSEDVARTSHAHPSLSEVVKEAALAVDGRMLHL